MWRLSVSSSLATRLLNRPNFLLVIASMVFCLLTAAASAQSPSTSLHGKDLTWMLDFNGKQTDQLVNDSRFTATLSAYFRHVLLPFNHEAVPNGLLSYFGPPNDVAVANNRYVVASACAPEFCQEKILLWADSEKSAPVLIVAVILLSREEAKDGKQGAHLWLISSLTSDGNSLPQSFVTSLRDWLKVEVYPALREDSAIAGGIKAATLLSAPTGKSQLLTLENLNLPAF